MFADDAFDPVLYSWWVPTLGGLAIVLAGLLLWCVLRKPKPSTKPVQTEAEAAKSRSTALGRVQEQYERFEKGEIDLREFHLKVAAIVREFGSQRMGRDMTAMTRAEVEESYPRGGVGVLLRRCEQPSFSRDSKAEARTTMDKVAEVIGKW